MLPNLTSLLPCFVLPVPLSQMTLAVIPSSLELSEGEELHFICSVNGTGPVTFKWYRTGSVVPLQTNTTTETYSILEIKPVSKNDSDEYYCEASNGANKVRSEHVNVQGETEQASPCSYWSYSILFKCQKQPQTTTFSSV